MMKFIPLNITIFLWVNAWVLIFGEYIKREKTLKFCEYGGGAEEVNPSIALTQLKMVQNVIHVCECYILILPRISLCQNNQTHSG